MDKLRAEALRGHFNIRRVHFGGTQLIEPGQTVQRMALQRKGALLRVGRYGPRCEGGHCVGCRDELCWQNIDGFGEDNHFDDYY